jgi:hypothetical protein
MDTFNPSQMPPMTSEPVKKSVAPLVAVIVILALIIIGGLYFLKQRSAQPIYTPPTEQTDEITDTLKQQGSSDELNAIEADLKATNLNNIDQGAAAIEAELQ